MAHAHEHARPSRARGGARTSLLLALLISAGFLVVEVMAAWLTGSLALLADAGHMLTDVAALGLALFAGWIGARPATPRRTYGLYRVEVLAALVNASSLIAVSLYIFWEAYHRLREPPPVSSLGLLAVALAGLAANALSAWLLARDAGDNLNVRAALTHVVADMLGSVGALVAGAVIFLTGWLYADPLASVVIALITLRSGWRLLGESVDILLEATPRGLEVGAVERALLSVPGVVGLHDLHAWTVTSGFLALSAHLTVLDARHDEVLLAATGLLRERFGISHATLQLESPALEEPLHHGCYVGADDSACLVPAAPAAVPDPHHGHRH